MKLKNRRSGEIKEFVLFDGKNELQGGATLKDLVEEWEDYEEPKEYYYISDFGAIRECEIGKFPEDEEDRKEIGSYFETEEEAEKAVGKLKAWKRLKDNGFKFKGWSWDDMSGVYYVDEISFDLEEYPDSDKDLDLLFGGEE